MDFQLKIGPTTQDARIQRAGALSKKGEDLIRAGDFDGALQAFSQAADIFPEYARAKNALAVISVHKGDWNKAARYFSEAFNLVPDDPVITLNAGRFLERLSKTEEAIKIYQSYLERKHDQNISQELARLKTGFLPGSEPSIQRSRHEEKQIVFISDMSPFIPRVPKFAYGLKQNGWDVVLLHRDALNFDPKKYFVETRQYRNPDEAAELAAAYRPLAYHVFSSWYFNTAAAVIRRKPGKIVLDDYDVMAGMVKKDILIRRYRGQLELERFCLENADGLCCRSLELQCAKRDLNYKIKGKMLFFPDYCWDFNTKSYLSDYSDKDGIHVVHCGNISLEKIHPENKEGHFLAIASAFSKVGVHFHIYPAYWGHRLEDLFSDYYKLPFVHVHYPVSNEQLIEEMKNYTVGLHVAGVKINQGINNNTYTMEKVKFAAANKIFDYIDAGLPVIICNAKLQRWFVDRYGIAIYASSALLDDPLSLLTDIDEKKKKVNHARSNYSIKKQVSRLVSFYGAL